MKNNTKISTRQSKVHKTHTHIVQEYSKKRNESLNPTQITLSSVQTTPFVKRIYGGNRIRIWHMCHISMLCMRNFKYIIFRNPWKTDQMIPINVAMQTIRGLFVSFSTVPKMYNASILKMLKWATIATS